MSDRGVLSVHTIVHEYGVLARNASVGYDNVDVARRRVRSRVTEERELVFPFCYVAFREEHALVDV